MKTAVNPPESVPHWDLGAMSYGLAHEAMKSRGYFDRLVWLGLSDRYLILDNGADELGEGMDGEVFYELIKQVVPQEIILPDVIQNPEETLKRGKSFLERDLEGFTVMAVAQGKTFDEWINNYLAWTADDRVHVVGIPYDIDFDVSADREPDPEHFNKTEIRALRRYNLVSYLDSHNLMPKPAHLLGMNNLEELRLHVVSGFPMIRSNDTTAPFGSALAGRRWVEGESGIRDYPSLRFDATEEEMESVGEDAMYNLAAYFSATNDIEGILNLSRLGSSR